MTTPTASHAAPALGTRDTVLIALFAALLVVLSLMPPVPLAVVPVPITLQTLGVMLAGLILGPVRGLLAVALYAVLALVGLPVLPGGRGGLGVVASPTFGFLMGMLPGAWLAGWLARRYAVRASSGWRATTAYALAAMAGGVLMVYAVGIPWLAAVAGIDLTRAALGSLVFVPGDLFKAIVAAIVAAQVRRAWPMALR